MNQRGRRGAHSAEKPVEMTLADPFDRVEAYVGFPASTSVTNALLDLQRRLERRREEDGYEVRWVKATRMYVDLRHMGFVLPEIFEPMVERLSEHFAQVPSIPARVARLTVRPSTDEPLAIWAELEAEEGALTALRASFDEILDEFGIEGTEQSFEPHITIGLIERVDDVARLLERLSSVPGNVASGFQISTLHLRARAVKVAGSEFETAGRIDLQIPVRHPEKPAPEPKPVPASDEAPDPRPKDPEVDRPSVLRTDPEADRPSVLRPDTEAAGPSLLSRPSPSPEPFRPPDESPE